MCIFLNELSIDYYSSTMSWGLFVAKFELLRAHCKFWNDIYCKHHFLNQSRVVNVDNTWIDINFGKFYERDLTFFVMKTCNWGRFTLAF